MTKKILIVVIDGCAMDYLSKEHAPHMHRLAAAGFSKKVTSATPSVTNVNHASILSGHFPKDHGVVGNYFYRRETGEEGFIEDARHMRGETIIDKYKQCGKSTALLTVKGKVLDVFGAPVDIGINLQKPDPSLLARFELEPPPGVATFEAYDWIFNACHQVISVDNPDLVYCTTNDYMMHNFAPDSAEAKMVMQTMDRWIGRIYELDPSREIYITADHGMNQKNRLIDLQKTMDQAGFKAFCLLALKDRYLENHRYQEGGAAYIYVKDETEIPDVIAFFEKCDFIDYVGDRFAAAEAFHLPPDNIGDIVVFSAPDAAFAELGAAEERINTRTHGSLYERDIPLIAVNARHPENYYKYSIDIVKGILETMPQA